MRRTSAAVLAQAAVLALLAMPVLSRPRAQKPDAPRQAPSFADDMAKLTSTVGLTEAQAEKLQALKADRDAALTKWDELNQKRISAIEQKLAKLRGGKSAKARGQLERQRKGLQAGRATVAASHERKMFGVLAREQRGKWNGPVLAEAVLKEFSKDKLDAKQTEKVRQICTVRGEGISAPVDPVKHETTFKAVKRQVYSTVLTAAQRQQYGKQNRPAQSRGKTSGSSRAKSTRR